MIPQDQLDFFREVLKKVREMFPGSHPVIGGGALRDAYHGKPIKDMDVFLRAKDHPFGLNSPYLSTVVPAGVSYGLRSDIHGVWNLTQQMGGYDIQLIVAEFEDLQDLAHTFDIGMSRITFDGDRMIVTADFLRDSQHKVFTILRADDDGQTLRSELRIERFLEKYPDFRKAA